VVGLDNQSEEFHFLDVEFAFFWLKVEVVFSKPFQYASGSFSLVREFLGENQDVVHVNDYPSVIDHVLENLLHHCLEGHQ
jgi:hypothetical protein